MTTIRFDRLEKLAEHLEIGVLGHEEFSFDFYNVEDWVFNKMGFPRLRESEPWRFGPMNYAEEFFGISPRAAYHLFQPKDQSPDDFGGVVLDGKATRYEVAANIRAFIEVMRK